MQIVDGSKLKILNLGESYQLEAGEHYGQKKKAIQLIPNGNI